MTLIIDPQTHMGAIRLYPVDDQGAHTTLTGHKTVLWADYQAYAALGVNVRCGACGGAFCDKHLHLYCDQQEVRHARLTM